MDQLVHQDQRAHLDTKDHQAWLGFLVSVVYLDEQGQKEEEEILAHLGHKDHLASKVKEEFKVLAVLLVLLEKLEIQETLDPLDLLESRAQLV